MAEILLVTLCGSVCGAEGWQDIEDYGNAQIDFLRKLLPYKNGIPSDDIFRRFFRALDPTEFQKLFCEWMKSLQPQVEGVIAIVGKASRHSFDDDHKWPKERYPQWRGLSSVIRIESTRKIGEKMTLETR
jgi:predicted phosphoadenosine phosphosulfate sulfurtransferase